MKLESKEGQRVPSVTFRTRNGDAWADVKSDDLFKGRTVVVFSLPGAFTPTCSSTHLPRYNELAPALRAAGVDEIVCLSVNDAFVMNAWAADQNCENITCLPDGNGEFSDGMGMLVDKADIGFGKRSWRYSMLVRDGVVEKMFIEPNKPGDPFEVSDADTMLRHLVPDAVQPADVTIFTKPGCSHCARAKQLLADANMRYEEVVMGRDGVSYATIRAVSGEATAPQVFINGARIGGADKLAEFLAGGSASRAA